MIKLTILYPEHQVKTIFRMNLKVLDGLVKRTGANWRSHKKRRLPWDGEFQGSRFFCRVAACGFSPRPSAPVADPADQEAARAQPVSGNACC